MNIKNNIVKLTLGLAVFMLVLKGLDWKVSKDLKETREELRREKIKNSELTKVKEGLYTKLVADSLTKKELKRINDSLGLELKNPKVITLIKWKIEDKEAPLDDIVIKDSLLTLNDYYPNKEDVFIQYTATVNTNTGEGIGSFKSTPQEFRLGIGQNKDGTYSINTKVPDYFKITHIDVQALPLETIEPIKSDNFGWILGGRIGQDFTRNNNYVKINAGIRYKDFYLSVGGGTNGTLETGIDFEF